jgi:hypothetical protein
MWRIRLAGEDSFADGVISLNIPKLSSRPKYGFPANAFFVRWSTRLMALSWLSSPPCGGRPHEHKWSPAAQTTTGTSPKGAAYPSPGWRHPQRALFARRVAVTLGYGPQKWESPERAAYRAATIGRPFRAQIPLRLDPGFSTAASKKRSLWMPPPWAGIYRPFGA